MQGRFVTQILVNNGKMKILIQLILQIAGERNQDYNPHRVTGPSPDHIKGQPAAIG